MPNELNIAQTQEVLEELGFKVFHSPGGPITYMRRDRLRRPRYYTLALNDQERIALAAFVKNLVIHAGVSRDKIEAARRTVLG